MCNDLRLVARIVALLQEHGIEVWLAGGWAEQLHGAVAPREHHDVDLLYSANNFDRVDEFMRTTAVLEIAAKHFAHKRAFEFDGVMVELILIEPGGITRYWGTEPYQWPATTLCDHDGTPKLASLEALDQYRSQRPPANPALHMPS